MVNWKTLSKLEIIFSSFRSNPWSDSDFVPHHRTGTTTRTPSPSGLSGPPRLSSPVTYTKTRVSFSPTQSRRGSRGGSGTYQCRFILGSRMWGPSSPLYSSWNWSGWFKYGVLESQHDLVVLPESHGSSRTFFIPLNKFNFPGKSVLAWTLTWLWFLTCPVTCRDSYRRILLWWFCSTREGWGVTSCRIPFS